MMALSKTIQETTRENLKKFEQAEHQRQLKRYADQQLAKKQRNALIYQIGELVLECWPWTEKLQPNQRKEDRDAEFTVLRSLLLRIAADKNYITQNTRNATVNNADCRNREE